MIQCKKKLQDICARDVSKIGFEVPLAPLSSIRIGGQVTSLIEPGSLGVLKDVVCLLKEEGLEGIPIGAGSNLLFPDGQLDAVLIKLSSGIFTDISIEGNVVRTGAGTLLSSLISKCAKNGLSGVEGLVGIPGTVGGAIIMNASSKAAVSDLLAKVHMLSPEGKALWVDAGEIDFSYRRSSARDMGIVLGAEFCLEPDSPENIRKRTKGFMLEKMSKQPLDKKTIGCIFKNPGSGVESCGRMIDAAGLKNLKIGGAVVSSKHANFIVNEDGALAQDVVSLMEKVRSIIKEKFSIELKPEIRVVEN